MTTKIDGKGFQETKHFDWVSHHDSLNCTVKYEITKWFGNWGDVNIKSRENISFGLTKDNDRIHRFLDFALSDVHTKQTKDNYL